MENQKNHDYENANVCFKSTSILTNSYQLINPTKGGCFSSIVNAEGREYVFFREKTGYLCYYLSDKNAETGYTVVQTKWCGQFYSVKTAIAPGGEVLALVSYREKGRNKGTTLLFLRETFSGSGIIKCERELPTEFADMGTSLLCEGGVVAIAMRQSISEEDKNLLLFRYIYMGTKPGENMFMVVDQEQYNSCGPLLLYAQDPNQPEMIMVSNVNQYNEVRIFSRPFQGKPVAYSVSVPPSVKGTFQVHEAKIVRTPDRRNHMFLQITYLENGKQRPCLLVLTTGVAGARFIQSSLIWSDDADRLYPDAMDVVLAREQIHVLLHGVDKTLQHLTLPANIGLAGTEAIQADPMPIAADSVNGHFSITADHHATVLYQSGEGMAHKLELDPKGDVWIEEGIGAADEDRLCELRAYTSRVCVCNPDGTACQEEKVQVWSDSYLHVELNGAFYDIGPEKRVEISTDAMGTFTLTHEANALGESDIYFNAPRLMRYGEKYTLRCCETLRSRFENLTANELINARKANGDYLLPEKYRNTAATESVSKAVQDLMREGGKNTFYHGATAFSVKMINEQPCYQQLRPDEVDDIVAQWKKNGIKEFFAGIADFFRAVGRGIAKVVESIFTKVKDAVKAVFRFVLEGIEYVVNTVIKVVQQVFDAVEVILSKIMVLFDDLFGWLGDPFDWEGLRRMEKAMNTVMHCGAKLIRNTIGYQHEWMNEGFQLVIQEIDQTVDQACQLLGNATLSTYRDKVNAAGGDGVFKIDNMILDKFMAGSNNIEVNSNELQEKMNGVLNQLDVEKLLDAIQEQATALCNREEIKAAVERIKNRFCSLDAVLNFKLTDLLLTLKDIIIIVLEGIHGVLDLCLDWACKLLDAFMEFFDLRIRIPFLGALYLAKFNKQLTLGNLASLIFASILHTTYKFMQRKPLFADDAAVNSFIRKVEQLTDHPMEVANRVDKETLLLFDKLCDGFQIGVHFLTALVDDPSSLATSPNAIKTLVFFTKWVIAVGGIAWLVFSFPNWGGEAKLPSYILWGISIVLAIVSTIQVVVTQLSTGKTSTIADVLSVTSTFIGFFYLAATFIADFALEKAGGDIVNDLLVCLSPTSRCCLMSAVLEFTQAASLAVAVSIDALVAGAGCVRLGNRYRGEAPLYGGAEEKKALAQ